MNKCIKIGVIGPESTAKSTLSEALAAHFGGEYIEEYARVYVERLGGVYDYSDVETIAHQQIKELFAEPDKPIQFFDTELIITKVWFEHKWGKVPAFLTDALAQNPIDFYLICAPDLPFVDDPLRENPHLREYLMAWYEREVRALGVPYSIITGRSHKRFQNAIEAVEQAITAWENT